MEQQQFVQVRFESCKVQQALDRAKHDTRVIEPNYIRKNEKHNCETNYVYIFSDGDIKGIDLFDKKQQFLANNTIKQQLQKELELNKKNNKNFREKKHALIQDSVITLSNSINEMYALGKITKQELNALFLENIKVLAKELGLKPLNVSIHFDEKTPHCHCMFAAYDNNGKSVANDLKKNYSKAQDLCGKVWEKVGFSRGIKKEFTHAKHLKVVEMHEKEIKTLKEQIKPLKQETKTLKTKQNLFEKKLIQNVESILKKGKTFWGFNGDILKSEMIKHLKFYSKIKPELEENKILKEQLFLKNVELEQQGKKIVAIENKTQKEIELLKQEKIENDKKIAREKELNDFKQSLIDILKKQQNDEKFLKEKLEELENKTPKKEKHNDFER